MATTEKWTVFFEAQASGLGPANWAEKEVKVEGKEESKQWAEGTEPGLLTKNPKKATFVTIQAATAAEAIKAVAAFYGRGIINDKVLVAKTSNIEEKAVVA